MEIEVTPYISQKIRLLSLLAIYMVFIQHGSYGLPETDFPRLFKDVISLGVCDFPVSFFFIVSGYFIARKFSGTCKWYLGELQKRFYSLFVPYSIFIALGFLIYGAGTDRTMLDGIGITSILPIVGPLWFVRTLLVLCLVSPVIIFLTRAASKLRPLQITLFIIFVLASFTPFPARKSLTMPTFYFTFGTFLAAHGPCLCGIHKETKFLLSSLALIILLTIKVIHSNLSSTPSSNEVFLRWLVVPCTIASFWYGYDLLLRSHTIQLHPLINAAATSTFFIYCSESFIRYAFSGLLARIHLLSDLNTPIGVIVLALILLSSSTTIAILLKRFTPRIYSILAGGR